MLSVIFHRKTSKTFEKQCLSQLFFHPPKSQNHQKLMKKTKKRKINQKDKIEVPSQGVNQHLGVDQI